MTSLPGRDHSNTLPASERDSILPICEKLTYYSFGPFGMEMGYKEHQYTASETCRPDILPTKPPECWLIEILYYQ